MTTLILILIMFLIILCGIIIFSQFRSSVKSLKQKPAQEAVMLHRMKNEHVADTLRKIEQVKAEEDPPEIKKLKELLKQFETTRDAWDCLIAVGDIYKNGAYPRFLPDEYVALNCYKIGAMCPDGEVAGLAQVKYIEVRTDPISSEDKKGKPLPTHYGERLCDMATQRIMATPYSSFTKPKQRKAQDTHQEARPQLQNWDDFMTGFDDFHDIEYDVVYDAVQEPVQVPTYYTNSQNVHDHSVVSIAKQNLAKIGKDRKENPTESIKELRMHILSNTELSDKDVSDALQVLDSLSSAQHSTFDKSESEILADVWTKIKETPDKVLQENLTETLGKQLASGVEHGHVVCSTGKITRMLGTFDGTGVSDMETTRPIWAVREEIATLASKIRKDMTEDLNNIQKTAYERGDLPELEAQMKEKFKEAVKKTYYDELQMNPKVLEPMVQTYIDAF